MVEIDVEPRGTAAFRVTVREGGGSTTHDVTDEEDAVGRLGEGADGRAFVEAAFRFLLDREPKESILGRFDLRVISRYFPEFEERIEDYL